MDIIEYDINASVPSFASQAGVELSLRMALVLMCLSLASQLEMFLG